jgi:hypothetical protein
MQTILKTLLPIVLACVLGIGCFSVQTKEIQDEIKRLQKEGKLMEAILQQQDARELAVEELKTINKLPRKGRLGQMWLEHCRPREFTVREYQILKQGTSNAAYHYLGCGKIMAQIGKAFADALPVAEGQ